MIATQNGLSGAGVDNRFIITARLLPITIEQTATAPSKTVAKLSVSIYIGDGMNGTLFSSTELNVQGLGNDKSKAYLNAIRSISPTNPNIQAAVEKGCQGIINYYDNTSASIISKAKALAQSGKHDEAVNTLASIPSNCKDYVLAQDLIASYGESAIEEVNLKLLNRARAIWSSSPTQEGAAQVRNVLCAISYPSSNIQNKVRELTNEMSAHFKEQNNKQWELLEKESQRWHERQIKQIESKSELEKQRLQNFHDRPVASIIGSIFGSIFGGPSSRNYRCNW